MFGSLKDISAKFLIILATVAAMSGPALALPEGAKNPKAAQTAANDDLKAVSGFWYTEGREGGVELYPCGTKICGRIAWLNDPADAEVSRDEKNPNPELRQRPLCHMEFIGGFTPEGDHHYTNGWIYSPRHGAEFSAHMTLIDHNTLKLRGYLFFPALGQSQIWTRGDDMPGCSAK